MTPAATGAESRYPAARSGEGDETFRARTRARVKRDWLRAHVQVVRRKGKTERLDHDLLRPRFHGSRDARLDTAAARNLDHALRLARGDVQRKTGAHVQ